MSFLNSTSFPTAAISTTPDFASAINAAISFSFLSLSLLIQAPTIVFKPFSLAIFGIISFPSVQAKERTVFV